MYSHLREFVLFPTFLSLSSDSTPQSLYIINVKAKVLSEGEQFLFLFTNFEKWTFA